MKRQTSRHARYLIILLVTAAACMLVGLQVRSNSPAAAAEGFAAAAEQPGTLPGTSTASSARLGFKFVGANRCSNAHCHGSLTRTPCPNYKGNELMKWQGEDPHSRSYDSIAEGGSKKARRRPGDLR